MNNIFNVSGENDNRIRTLAKRPLALTAFGVGFISLGLNCASLTIHIVYSKGRQVYGSPIVGIVVVLMASTWIGVDTFWQQSIGKKLPWNIGRTRKVCAWIVLWLAAVLVVQSVISLASDTFSVPTYEESNSDILKNKEAWLTVVDGLNLVANCIFALLVNQIIFWPAYRAARSTLWLGGLLQFVLGVIVIVCNYFHNPVAQARPGLQAWFLFFQNAGAIHVALAISSLSICIVVGETDRLSKMSSRFVTFYLTYSAICMVITIVYFGMALKVLSTSNPAAFINKADVLHTNPALAAVALCLDIITSIAAVKLQKKPKSNLSVEVIDISKLTQLQSDAYANLIDRYSRQYPGAPSGREAMSLMSGYTKTSVPGMCCVVLRIYKTENNKKRSTQMMNWAISKYIPPESYEQIREWENLDKQGIIPQSDLEMNKSKLFETSSVCSSASTSTTVTMSKNKLKRLQKKTAKAGKKENTVPFPLDTPKTAEQIQEEVEFNEKLMTTEALVLLTKIEDYDLTSTLSGRIGKFIQMLFGKDSKSKWLCVRLGLLAFHWPFRQSTFYCGPSRRPVARNAAILRAITEWNGQLPKKERCMIHLDPKYEQDYAEMAITPSGWHPVQLPPSHIIDLRPHKGKTLEEYLRSVKYRNQSGAFNSANGQVVESHEFTDKECATALKLWKNIAEKRTKDGNTTVLATPNEDMIQTLGNCKHRSLLFLKVNNEVIASCVLFRLGETITSDLQGLDHGQARQFKAYFVMMQKTIEIALKEGCSFVDFGPTTSKPKLDIGCKSIPLRGGMFSQHTLLNFSLKFAATNVKVDASSKTS
jgi:hypothetical protein